MTIGTQMFLQFRVLCVTRSWNEGSQVIPSRRYVGGGPVEPRSGGST